MNDRKMYSDEKHSAIGVVNFFILLLVRIAEKAKVSLLFRLSTLEWTQTPSPNF